MLTHLINSILFKFFFKTGNRRTPGPCRALPGRAAPPRHSISAAQPTSRARPLLSPCPPACAFLRAGAGCPEGPAPRRLFPVRFPERGADRMRKAAEGSAAAALGYAMSGRNSTQLRRPQERLLFFSESMPCFWMALQLTITVFGQRCVMKTSTLLTAFFVRIIS